MGMFSWMLADKNNEESLKVGQEAYVSCPDGSFIHDEDYDGYGHFNGLDIFDLVVDWNRDDMDIDMLRKPVRKTYGPDDEGLQYYRKGLQAYGKTVKCLCDWKSHNVTADVMSDRYGSNWKRNLGIDISCYDDQNAALPFPIKITKGTSVPYSDLPSSNGDPDQGWG